MRFKAHFQEAYLDKGDIEQMAGAAGYGSANNAKHVKMEYAFMNFMLTIAAWDVDFT